MSQDARSANTNTNNNVATIQTAADTQFIANVDAAILTAQGFGMYQCTLTSLAGVNLQTVYTYYTNLGYQVSFPDEVSNLNADPALLFGSMLDAYYYNLINNLNLQNPVRMTFDWSFNAPVYYPPDDEV